jgi:hypothetical protein
MPSGLPGRPKQCDSKLQIKSAHVAEALSGLWDGSVGQGAHVAESLSK